MKLKLVILVICTSFFTGCNNDSIEEAFEITLSNPIAKVGLDKPIEEIDILSGNGGYKIIYPKQLRIFNSDVPYCASLLKVNIEGDNKIIVERTATFENTVDGHFLIMDQKGKKRVLFVTTNREGVGGILTIKELEEVERYLLKDHNYWQY